ncbi:hypothetical protein CHS0354_018468 [Potamilus streckersoni]|uniref:D-3-phosphoglycerate dehydrogenase n=1 Tax=Potamilus streckersoni TaxID=2493646 RepID=A0AAE0TBM9_9BIVA|nr:hypothetical protein CHS0354_018468 [Potamilus streckersoni]
MKSILKYLPLPVVFFAVSAVTVQAQALKTEKEKISYAMGMNIIKSFQEQGLELDEKTFIKAIQDTLGNKKNLMTEDEMRTVLTDFSQKFQVQRQAKAEKDFQNEKAAGAKFHAAKKKEQNVTTLPSGLQYKVIKAGKGQKPTADDTVKVHYQGTLTNGKEFDSSYKRNEPAIFPLKGVIPGWTEVLQLMPVGSVWEVYLPENLAYGKNAPPGSVIMPGATLIFKIELLSIEKTDIICDYLPDLPRPELLDRISAYDAIISRSETDIDRELIDRGTALKVIARAAVGYGNIDVDYASSKGILVFNTPGVNTNSAAELTLGLMLAVYRKIVPAHASMSGGKWNRHIFTGRELAGKTVGIIGLGNVGHRVAHFLSAFDCKMMVYDPYITDDYIAKNHCTRSPDFSTLIKEADIITVHTPKNKNTVNLIAAEEFEIMKPGAVIINAARGGIVNEKDLLDALNSGRVSAAGIDTFDKEPPSPDDPLIKHPNVVLTPHIGASTEEAQYKIGCTVVSETVKGLRGGLSHVRKYSALAERMGKFSAQYLDESFGPVNFEFLFRGNLAMKDAGLIKLSFLKSFLSQYTSSHVSYVNALAVAAEKGFNIEENDDQSFSDYESAIRIIIRSKSDRFSIGGTVLGHRMRLSYFQGLAFEVEPEGRMLIAENRDIPGVIGHLGTVLSNHQVNINQLYLSRYEQKGNAVTIMRIDEDITEPVMQDLRALPAVLKVTYINLN